MNSMDLNLANLHKSASTPKGSKKKKNKTPPELSMKLMDFIKSKEAQAYRKNKNKVIKKSESDHPRQDVRDRIVVNKPGNNGNADVGWRNRNAEALNSMLEEDDRLHRQASGKSEGRNSKAKSPSVLKKRSIEAILEDDKDGLDMYKENEDIEVMKGRTADKMSFNEDNAESLDQIFRQLKKVHKDNKKENINMLKKEPKELQERPPKQDLVKEVASPHAYKHQVNAYQPSQEPESKQAPWMSSSTMRIENTLIRFHNEIIDFVEHIGPTKGDQELRKKSYEKLVAFIKETVPTATVKPFGSFVTNLYLPQSDIDVAVLEPNITTHHLLNKVARAFMQNRTYENINVIRSAKVPLVKVVESSTGINFDISFNKLDGINQVKEIVKALDYYPEMKYLILIVKLFLKQRELNETYQGGIGSFLLFCLVLTFLREVRRDYAEQNKDDEVDKILLSEYLLKFLDFFANFDFTTRQIRVGEGGSIVSKYHRNFSLSVVSPQDDSHDIGGPVFRVKEIFGIFKNRYHFLINYNFKKGESILKYLVGAE